MPLFTVKETGIEKPRLIEAKSSLAALEYVTAQRFTVEKVGKAADVAKIMASGVMLEDSLTPPASAPEPHPVPEAEQPEAKTKA